jgi:hypothetical protein
MALQLTNSPESTATPDPAATLTSIPKSIRKLQIRFTDGDGDEFHLENHYFKYLQLNELDFVTTKLKEALTAIKNAKHFVTQCTKVSNKSTTHKSPPEDFDLLHSFCYGGSETIPLRLTESLGEAFSRELKNRLLKVRPQPYLDIISYTSIDEFNSESIRNNFSVYCGICERNSTSTTIDKSFSKAFLSSESFQRALAEDIRKYWQRPPSPSWSYFDLSFASNRTPPSKPISEVNNVDYKTPQSREIDQ